MNQPDIAGFSQVDHTSDGAFLIRFVDDANALEPVRACKQRMLALLRVTAGQQLLDVGCGAGDDVRELARLVGSAGRVVGVDSSAEMIAEAQRRSRGLNLPAAFCVNLEAGQHAGMLSVTEVANWQRSSAEYDRAGFFFCALQGFIVAGRKPSLTTGVW